MESLEFFCPLSREGKLSIRNDSLFSLFPPPPSPPLSNLRYVFLLYRQRAPLGTSAKEPKSRAKFQVKDWAKSHKLECVDATFFSTPADEE